MTRRSHHSESKLPVRELLSDQVSAEEVAVILRELSRTNEVAGDVVEFGCYVGTTSVYLARHLRQLSHKTLHVYDSFMGLPPKTSHDESPAGVQFTAGELAATKKQFIHNFRKAQLPLPHITKAWFNELTPNDVPPCISFAFLDGDYYHSILDPLNLIWPNLSPGAIVVVDDYANEALPGAARAVNEWLESHTATFRCEASLAILQIPK